MTLLSRSTAGLEDGAEGGLDDNAILVQLINRRARFGIKTREKTKDSKSTPNLFYMLIRSGSYALNTLRAFTNVVLPLTIWFSASSILTNLYSIKKIT